MRLTCRMLAVVAVGLAVGAVTAQAAPDKRFDERSQTCRLLDFYNSGWASVGARIFKESCQKCHAQGNRDGVPFLHTESKSMKAWNRVFAQRYPRCARDGAWSGLNDNDLERLNDFLYYNAADTYDPNSASGCG